MAFKQYRGNSVFEVWIIKRRDGSWEHKAYQCKGGDRVKDPPKTLEKKYLGRVQCRYPIDAIRAAISNQFGDDSDEAAEQLSASPGLSYQQALDAEAKIGSGKATGLPHLAAVCKTLSLAHAVHPARTYDGAVKRGLDANAVRKLDPVEFGSLQFE